MHRQTDPRANDSGAKAVTLTLSLPGLDCQCCARRLETRLGSEPGVRSIRVSLFQQQATLSLDDEKALPSLLPLIESAGFDPGRSRTRLHLRGVSFDAPDALSIRRSIESLHGVSAVEIDLLRDEILVEYDPVQTDIQAIHAAIRRSGYAAVDKEQKVRSGIGWGAIILAFLAAGGATLLEVSLATFGDSGAAYAWIRTAALSSWPSLGLLRAGVAGGALIAIALLLGWLMKDAAIVGWASLRRGRISAGLLYTVSVATLLLASMAQTFVSLLAPDAGVVTGLHYVTASWLVLVWLIAVRADTTARQRAASWSNRFAKLDGGETRLVKGDRVVEVPAAEISTDDVVELRKGDQAWIDGTVVEGEARVEEMTAGEPNAVSKSTGDPLFSGCRIVEGTLRVRVTAAANETMHKRMAAVLSRPVGPAEMKASRALMVATALLAPAALAGWAILTPAHPWSYAIAAFAAVLVAVAPRAVSLVSAAFHDAALRRGTEIGVYARSASCYDVLGRVQALLLRPRGVITGGNPRVTEYVLLGGISQSELLRVASAAAENADHPVARAIASRGNAVAAGAERRDYHGSEGKGVRSVVDGRTVRVGRIEFLAAEGIDVSGISEELAGFTAAGKNTIGIAIEQQLSGLIVVSDAARPAAPAAMHRIEALGFEPRILSGEDVATAGAIASAAGIAAFTAAASSGRRIEIATSLRRESPVAGVSADPRDLQFLAATDLGIAFGPAASNLDADMIITGEEPGILAEICETARAMIGSIRKRIRLAIIFNVIALSLAALTGGIVPAPFFAAAAVLATIAFPLRRRLENARGGEPGSA
ncbi:MAG: HAD-IC family P-type ATPase [Thermoanaerobaculia bacterium]